ncbi:unnamed protein product [Effrenium voratum]|uniref:Uncharacterized protein n=1 Tax=Effrenium voratum TaxID=2562239 RepID=A0AA36I0N5_9DINO|nr:unnamed protein product [Effrenium voratum]
MAYRSAASPWRVEHALAGVPSQETRAKPSSLRLGVRGARLERRRWASSAASGVFSSFCAVYSWRRRCLRQRGRCRAKEDEESESRIELDDELLLRSLQKRIQEVGVQEKARRAVVDRHWREGKAQVRPAALVNDWVRRVLLVGEDLFVGTASSGVRRYHLGEEEPLSSFLVQGDPSHSVAADHLAEVDPETSVTSLAWDGLRGLLCAGLAGGRLQVWAEGEPEPLLDFLAPWKLS